MKVYTSVSIIILLFLSISVHAGLVVKMNQEADGMNIKSQQTMFIEKDRLRMEMSGEEENQTIIFRGDKNVFWVVDNTKNPTSR